MRIMVVDDDYTNRLVVRLLMELRGVAVIEAEGGAEAARILENEQVDAVFMDIHMPEMDGFEATRMLRAKVLDGQVPVFALTSSTSDEARRLCIESGMNGFIRKPFEAGVAEEVHSIMERQRLANAESPATWMLG
jgi:CheY-like chemotaxis protein